MPRTPLLLLALLTLAVHTGEVQLSANKQPALPIVLSADASPALKKTAADFAKVLGQLAGTDFKLETGDGLSGIALGTAANFPNVTLAEKFSNSPFERETYILRSHDKGLQLIGASDLAVSHAAWDLLHRLGHRQYFPGATWEVLPPARDLKLAIEIRERPAFAARRIWYNWGLWGYNNQPYDEWCTRNRMVKGFDLQSGHAYDNIFASNKAEFEKHPEYLALVNGQRRTAGGDIKFCVSNAGLRKLVADYALAQVQKNPHLDSVSMDPSDGDNWCECEDCKKMGSVSNRVVTLANEVAVAINAFAKEKNLGEKYVGSYAYNKHSAPPTVKVDPHVIISATTAFIGGGFTFDQVVSGWKAQGATVGVYDYLSVVDWDWNLPRGSSGSRPAHVAGSLKKFHSMGARFYDAESGDCWGPCGLGYYTASRVLWNVADAENVAAITEEFLSNCFGPAKEPMREFYRLINFDNQRRSPSDLTGRMYRQLDAARKLTDDPKIRERLDHLILYTRHAELYSAFANAAGSRDDVVRHDYRIRKTMMVHSYGLWSRLLTQRDALTEKHPLKDDRPFSADEITKILTEGIAKNQPVETGFASVEFSKKLVPAAEKLKLAPVAAGRFPDAPQDYQQYHLWMKNAGTLELLIAVQKVWANRAPKLSLYSPLEVTLDPVTVDETYKPDGQTNTLKLKTPHAGLHKIITLDGGDHTRIQWPTGLPVSIESGIDTPQVTSHFRGGWALYFYVPKGTKLIGGWASRIANWAPKISGTLVDPSGKVAIDFAKLEDGWFKAEVPEGTDGKLWKFENALGQRLLMTVPPYLARSAEELLLPEEVVEKDAQ